MSLCGCTSRSGSFRTSELQLDRDAKHPMDTCWALLRRLPKLARLRRLSLRCLALADVTARTALFTLPA